MSDYLERRRAAKCAVLLLRRYFDHHVARDSAALTYYLLFAFFPLLIFLNNVVGMLAINIDSLLVELSGVIPREVLSLAQQYLLHVSRESSRTLMLFGLIFTFYFPYRAVNALFMSVRKAYDVGMPTRFVRYQLRVTLYTLALILSGALLLPLSVVGRRALEFLSDYIYLSDAAIHLWDRLRFVFLGAVLFLMIALLHALAPEQGGPRRSVLPGVLTSLVGWVGLSMLFSLYVEQASHYSVIYGSIGAIIVLLLWLYLSASVLILGAEFNSVLLSTSKHKGDFNT